MLSEVEACVKKFILMNCKIKSLIKISLIFVFNLWISLHLFAQTSVDSSLVGRKIISVKIQGNRKTKPSVILREMKQKIGNCLNPQSLEEDRKRIESLYLFNRVVIRAEPEGEGVCLHIVVTERWYFFPYPIFFINERSWSKLSYGAGLTHLNFRGYGDIFTFLFWLGYNPAFQFFYTNPWFNRKHNLSASISFFYNRVRSKHFEKKEITENHMGFQWVLGKRFGLYKFFSLTLGYQEIRFSPSIQGQTLSSDGRDRLPMLSFLLIYDHRDLKEYPHSGWYARLYARKTGFPFLTVNYFRYSFDIRKYFPMLHSSTLALRTAADLSEGKIPVYDRVYLGYSERVRGHFFEKFEGENRALASVVFRFSLLPVRYFNISSLSQLKDLKFGISFGFFADTGLTWFQKEKIESSMLQSGYGCGIHFHLPYINILRLEMAFNERRKKQFIADLNIDI